RGRTNTAKSPRGAGETGGGPAGRKHAQRLCAFAQGIQVAGRVELQLTPRTGRRLKPVEGEPMGQIREPVDQGQEGDRVGVLADRGCKSAVQRDATAAR